MKRRIIMIISMLFVGITVAGCEEKSNAVEVYNTALSNMKETTTYYRMESTFYRNGSIVTQSESENLFKEDKFQSIMYIRSEDEGEFTTVIDGTILHTLYPDDAGKLVYTVGEGEIHIDKDYTIRKEDVSSSSSAKTKDGQILYFVFSRNDMGENSGKTEYEMTIENDRIIKVITKEYASEENQLVQEGVTTLSNFNTKDAIDIDSVINEMKQ